jgi:hypothetical protein
MAHGCESLANDAANPSAFIVVWQFHCHRKLTMLAQANTRADGTNGHVAGEHKTDESIIAAAAAKASKRNWDASTLLNEDQREAVLALGELLQFRPLARAEWNAPPPAESAVADLSPAHVLTEELSVAALYRRLGEEQEAANVFHEDDLEDVQDHYERMVSIVQLCDKIVCLLTIVEKTLVGLQTQHDCVVEKTSALHAECETLLSDKLELEALAKSIESRLKVNLNLPPALVLSCCVLSLPSKPALDQKL